MTLGNAIELLELIVMAYIALRLGKFSVDLKRKVLRGKHEEDIDNNMLN